MKLQTHTNTTYLPAEWAPQSGILFSWPHTYDHGSYYWKPHEIARVEMALFEMVSTIAKTQPVMINVYNNIVLEHLEDLLRKAKVNRDNVQMIINPSNDIWVRDHGPITVYKNQKAVLLNFKFNGWGEKFPHEDDNAVNNAIHHFDILKSYPREDIDYVLEGGSIETDGLGTLLTTRLCLCNPNRNKVTDKAVIFEKLQAAFGIQRILWLDDGFIEGDNTDSHIDMLARFINPQTIAYASCDDPSQPHYESLLKMEAQLKSFKQISGEPYQLVPMLLPKVEHASYPGVFIPATYLNFLITNDCVFVPQYNHALDGIMLETLREWFPSRNVLGVDTSTLILQSGGLHCSTMQIPTGQQSA